jgi:YD repeat-containing protein
MRYGILWAVVALLLGGATQAFAQTGGIISPPAERFATSPGGVDMRSGEYQYSQTDVSIGEDSERGGLALTRSLSSDVLGHLSPFANFSHNWEIMITEKFVSIQDGNFERGAGADLMISVHFGGRSETFQSPSGQSTFEQSSRNPRASLTYTGAKGSAGSIYTFRATDGAIAVFRILSATECSSIDRCAYVSYIVHTDGTRIDFEYDALGTGAANVARLRSVRSSRGFALLFEYDSGNANQVAKACVLNLSVIAKPTTNICPVGAQATATYNYSGTNPTRRLATATDANGAASTFTYTVTGSGTEMRFFRPGQATAWLTNTFFERMNNDGVVEEIVGRQDFADGSFYTYGFTESPAMEGQIPSIAGGTYTNAMNETVTLEYGFFLLPATFSGPAPVNCCTLKFQITPGPIRVTDPLGRVTITDWCDPNALANLPPYEHNRCLVRTMPVSVTDPEGIRTNMTWDLLVRNLQQTQQIARPGSGSATITTSATFDCAVIINCAKPVTHTDPRGNVTSYTYDPVHGGLLTETGPAVSVTSSSGTVTTGIAPQTRYSYAQRYAWISNGSGGYVQAATPVWVLTSTSMCRTSAATGTPSAPCAIGGDEVLTTFDYGPNSGPNTLLLRGQIVTADGVALRTCFAYDARGRRISERLPNANLTSCP